MIEKLFDIAEKNNIDIDYFKMRKVSSLSVPGAVALDTRKLSDTTDANVHLAHELGHCITGSFYNIYCKYETKNRHEYRADKWAITTLIPFDILSEALQNGMTEKWQLAEHFEVTEPFIEKVLCFYENKLLELKSH